jgi:energy-coupling factor transporter ATP-binding protein EcfA2
MQWIWPKADEKYLAHFVTDRAIQLLRLSENRFDLVQSREGRRRLVEVIYNTLVDKQINYAWEKYDPDDDIQLIRNPYEILYPPHEGTCLDLALLFCGLCFGYDLLPLLIIIEGHALAAVSLNHKRHKDKWGEGEWKTITAERNFFNTRELFAGEGNLEKLLKLIDDGAYVAIECTGFARTQSFRGSAPEAVGRTEAGFLTFEHAVAAGREQLDNQHRAFNFAIDIAVAHYSWKIKPFSIPYPPLQPSTPLTQRDREEDEQRKNLLNKVKNWWIKDVLKNSLHLKALITLGLKKQIKAVDIPIVGVQEVPNQYEQALPSGIDVTDLFYEMGDGRTLLILGEPGAGKTITLLKVAEKLIAHSEEDLNRKIPVIFNLSSWASERLTITDWLVQELNSQYHVPKDIGATWIKKQKLLLLLDGLDEVKAEHQKECVLALNKFIQDHGRTEMVVCSRVKDYQALSARLKLQAAICIQPLTPEQVNQYLDRAGEQLEAVKTLLQQDTTLLKFARSPLMLSIMTLAYQGKSVADLPHTGSIEEHRQQLFKAYIKGMFERRRASQRYSEKQAVRWLNWLAQRLSQSSQTMTILFIAPRQPSQESQPIFLIERMQPSWLQNPLGKFIYSIGVGLTYGLAFGLSTGLPIWWSYGPIYGLASGLIFGLAFGLSAWLIVGLDIDRIIELIVEVILDQISQLIGRGTIKQNYSETVRTQIPNQEIRESARSGVVWGGIGALCGGLLSIVFQPQFFLIGVIFGLAYGAITQGRVAMKHFNLRVVLYWGGYIPWNYAKFLDYACELLFLQKVGGGYIFIHRLLQEHFAKMKRDA